MKVLLVQPEDGPLNVLKLAFRPLTLEWLAAYLDEHEVDIYDMRVDDVAVSEKLAAFDPDVIGITCPFSVTVPVVLDLISRIRESRPDTPVVVGGVHPSLLPGDLEKSGVTAIVKGPGEHAFRDLVRAVAEGTALVRVPNLYVRRNGSFTYTGDRPEAYSLDGFRHPARNLTRKYDAKYPRSIKGQTMAITITSRGCPYRCSFCAAWKVQEGRFLMREVDNIVDEFRNTGQELIYLFDDNSFGNAPRMSALARRLDEEGIRKEYQMWASSNTIAAHEDLVQAWAGVGLKRVFVGFESCLDSHLQQYNKTASVALNEKAFRVLQEHGVDLSPTFIVRYDFTALDFQRLHEYLVHKRFLMPYPLIYTPLPGTELWDRHAHELVTADYAHFDLYHLTLRPEHMAPNEFMNRFTDLYLQNPSWQAVAQRSPVARAMLDGIGNLRLLYPR